MTDELKRRMARLREIAPRLNSATDKASRLVAQVEKFLVEELHIGVSAEVSYDELPAGTDQDNRPLKIRHSLAFGRVGGSFRIHVVSETVAVNGGASAEAAVAHERMPWPSCTRETRLKAFEKLPELLDKIIDAAERLAESSETTRVKVEAMIADEEPVEVGSGRASVFESSGAWTRQLVDAAHRYRQCERDAVESEIDSGAWEARMEAEGRVDDQKSSSAMARGVLDPGGIGRAALDRSTAFARSIGIASDWFGIDREAPPGRAVSAHLAADPRGGRAGRDDGTGGVGI